MIINKLILAVVAVFSAAVLLSACGGGSSNGSGGAAQPVVSAVTPTPDTKEVSYNAVISATFSSAMTSSSITGSSFVLSTATATSVSGTVTYDALTKKAVFAPSAAEKLATATTYTATITTGAKDSAGTALASNYSWSFKTTHLDEYLFGTKGKVATNVGATTTTDDIAYAVAIQADGKIVVAGDATDSVAGDTPRFALARYTTAGVLDTTFNSTGIQRQAHIGSSTWDQIRAMAIDATGKIVVAGWSDGDTLVARYNANGTPDSTFGTAGTGVVVDDLSGTTHDDSAFSTAIQTDGTIIVAGSSACGGSFHTCLALARYNSTTGSRISVTTTDIEATATGIRSIAIDSTGRIVAAAATGADQVGNVGKHIVVVRYSSTGVLDTSFNAASTPGYIVTNLSTYGDSAQAIAIQPLDNKILVAGWAGQDAVVLRYNVDGSIDTTFGTQGRAVTDIGSGNNYALALALQSDGKIVAAGTAPNPLDSGDDVFALMRYTATGTLDTTFENNGVALLNFTAPNNVDAAHAIAVDPTSGKIVIAGEAGGDFGVARYVK